MNKLSTILVVCACILVVGWLWKQQNPGCERPLHYRIGQVDERFDINIREYRNIVQEAGELWERALGENLFAYDPTASFTINLVYDERQRATLTSQELSRQMKQTENSNQKVLALHEHWQDIYDTHSRDYEAALEAYQKRLEAYNATVEDWNSKGGVPQAEYDALTQERDAIEAARHDLESKREEIEEVTQTLTDLEAESKTLVASYNRNARSYNTLYGVQTPFHKGEYDGKAITIFQYHDDDDLLLVLTHEMGHALGVDHIDTPEAIMHALMGAQNLNDLTPTPEDIKALRAACGGH